MTKDMIEKLFTYMDDFRHFPDYQLERRADLFFYLYLPLILKKKLNITVKEPIIPEFPIKIDIINRLRSGSNHSIKIDYFAISDDDKKAVLIELKTDSSSIKFEQTSNLIEACNNNLQILLNGVIAVTNQSSNKRKYLCLLNSLNKLGLFQSMPAELEEIRKNKTLRGMKRKLDDITIEPSIRHLKPTPVYILPNDKVKTNEGIKTITFNDYLTELQKLNEPVSQRFAGSLKNWSNNEAGIG